MKTYMVHFMMAGLMERKRWIEATDAQEAEDTICAAHGDDVTIFSCIQEAQPEHECDLCGHKTGNVRMDCSTGEVEPDICDACLREHYPNVNW